MRRRPIILLLTICLIQGAALLYLLFFTRIIWKKEGPNWIYEPRAIEFLIWRDKTTGAHLHLQANDAGGQCFVVQKEKNGDRYITIEFHADHVAVWNSLLGGPSPVHVIDVDGDGIPEKRISDEPGARRAYALAGIDWQETKPNQSVDPTPVNAPRTSGSHPQD